MKSLSNLSTALIIAAAIVLIGNILNGGLASVAAVIVGILGVTSSGPSVQTVFLYYFSGILFALGVGLAILSITIERKKNK